jgi:hypothetical protein
VTSCEICDGSGVLNAEVVDWVDLSRLDAVWEPRATWCHGCPNGEMMKEFLE